MDHSVKKLLAKRKAARKLGLSPRAFEHHPTTKKHPKKAHHKKRAKTHHAKAPGTHHAAHKRHSKKAAFIRSQEHKGRSHAQALAAWNLCRHRG